MRDTEENECKTYRDDTPLQTAYQERFDVFGAKTFKPAFLDIVEKEGGDRYGVCHNSGLLILTATIVTEGFGCRKDVG